MNTFKDLTNKKFGRWTVKSIAGQNNRKKYLWNCICDCGTEKIIMSTSLISGNSKSCGCYQKEVVTRHGLFSHPLAHVHRSMMDRCYNDRCPSYKDYGARGIEVCERWKDVKNFVADLEKSYLTAKKNGGYISLDRINNNKSYSPTNTRWADRKTQQNNRRTNHFIQFEGIELTIAQWADRQCMKRETLVSRLRNNWPIEKALTQPVKV